MELLALVGLLVVGGAICFAVLATVWAIIKFSFKIVFIPLAIVGSVLCLVVAIPIGLVALPFMALLVVACGALALICCICWLGFTALAAIF